MSSSGRLARFLWISGLVVMLVSFQNCAPQFKAIEVEGIDGANLLSSVSENTGDTQKILCNSEAVKGTWTAENFLFDQVTFRDDCTGTSRYCDSEFRYEPNLDGKDEILLNISKTSEAPGCLPKGEYRCGYSTSEDGQKLTYTCSGGVELSFFRGTVGIPSIQELLPTATPTPTPDPNMPTPTPTGNAAPTPTPSMIAKKIYVTAAVPSGNLGGIAGADALCMSSGRRPSSVAIAKALVVDGVSRRACSTAFCAGEKESIDWPLQGNVSYYNTAGNLIGTTNAKGLFFLPMPSYRGFSTTYETIWTGLNANWTSNSANCMGFTSASPAAMSKVGISFVPVQQLIDNGTNSCDSAIQSIVCVEQ